jgi:hypothetical protein
MNMPSGRLQESENGLLWSVTKETRNNGLGIMIPSGATTIYIEGPLLEGTFYVFFSLHVSA